jgi:hypothetical protein
MAVLVKILGLKSDTKKLEISFDFRRFAGVQDVAVRNIKVYKNDSLLYQLESESQTITNWKFPQIPDGFKIKYPENTDSLGEFQKSDNLRFEFQGIGKYAAYGSWSYQPKFATPKYRWLFDEDGNKKVNIDCYYEPWVGKDIIKIISTNEFQVNNESFQLHDKSGEPIEFEIKSKKELTNRVALILKRDLEKGEVLLLSFKVQDDKIYEQEIIVPDKSTIGLAGKFNDL